MATSIMLPLPAHAQDYRLPAPGLMVPLSLKFDPPILKGIKVLPDNPFRFDFILDKGDNRNLSNQQIKEQSTKLIKYFLASLTIPENDLWVNLSPYEKNRIIPQSFGLTEMGRDLLAEDYMLKQITASLIYPDGKIGREFWKKVYAKAEKEYGTTNIPVNTFNKVWIVPEKAVVYENAKAGTAYVVQAKLKVMLEQDYLSLKEHEGIRGPVPSQGQQTNQIGSQVVRQVVIPELTREVNEDKNFAPLRQVYNSLILATWYKKKIKDSILERVYTDKNKVAGVNIDDPKEIQKIYQRYLRAFKKGVFNFIKEDQTPDGQVVARKYFSGGVGFTDMAMQTAMTFSHIPPETENQSDLAQVTVGLDMAGKNGLSEKEKVAIIGSITYRLFRKYPSYNFRHDTGPLESAAAIGVLKALEEQSPDRSKYTEEDWLRMVGWFRALDERRKQERKREKQFGKDDGGSSLEKMVPSREDTQKAIEVKIDIQDKLEHLSPAAFLLIDNYFYKSMTQQKIAAELSVNKFTVSQWIREILAQMRGNNYVNFDLKLKLEPGFGLEIKAIRKKLSMSQEDLSSKLDIATNVVQAWEEERLTPTYNQWHRLSELSKTPLTEFISRKIRVEGKVIQKRRKRYKTKKYATETAIKAARTLGVALPNAKRKYATVPAVEAELAKREKEGLTNNAAALMESPTNGEDSALYRAAQTLGVELPNANVKYATVPAVRAKLAEREKEGLANNPGALLKTGAEGGDTALYRAAKTFGVALPRNRGKGYKTKAAVEAELAKREKEGLANSPKDLSKPKGQGGNQALYQAAKTFRVTLPNAKMKYATKEAVEAELTRRVEAGLGNTVGELLKPKAAGGDQALYRRTKTFGVALPRKRGGIDLTAANMNLQTQNAGDEIKFHLDPAMLQRLQNASGFVPVIIDVQPMTNLRGFLGLKTVFISTRP